jgi:hypothetical protein
MGRDVNDIRDALVAGDERGRLVQFASMPTPFFRQLS